jgi:hypothetical protein
MLGNSAATWTVFYESQARQLMSARVTFRATTRPITMTTTLLAVSETNPPWYLDELLHTCDHNS